jgi:thermostable 8-oxoguanine DNA glycosylase
MVSNESLSIAFLCLASNYEKETFLQEVKDRYKNWYTTENGIYLQNAIQLPNHRISEKIKYLQLALDPEKHGNKVREIMANRIAGAGLKQSLAYLRDEDDDN